jgi:hypothetical protein
VLQNLFLELRGTVDPVHDVERATLSPDALPDPVAQPAPNRAASSTKPSLSSANTEKDASRTQV